MHSKGRNRNAAIVAILLFLSVLIGYLVRVCLSVAIPFIAEDFNWTTAQTGSLGGLLLGVFLIGYGLSNIFLGPMLDCFGPRKGIIIAVATWSIFTLLTGLVGMYYAAFVLLRVSLGLSQGPLFPSASRAIQAWYPPRMRSRMNSLYHSSTSLSNLLSPLLLLPLIMATSWNFMFIVLAVAGFVLLIPIWKYLQDTPEGPIECEDESIRANLKITIGNLRAAMKVKGLKTLIIAKILETQVWWGLSLWLPTFLMMARGFSSEELIWAASLPYLGSFAGLAIGSYLSDRTGHRAAITASFLTMSAISLIFVTQAHEKLEVIVALAVVFFFLSVMGPNVFTMLQGTCKSRLTCTATGLVNGISNGVGALGPILFGAIASTTGSYDSALPLMIILLIISAVVIFRFRIYEIPLDELNELEQ
ncbi:MAG: MFS transporter [Euryarchaeota archaeon]|nr:MFS transporter [Euryarchaeota archaeon]